MIVYRIKIPNSNKQIILFGALVEYFPDLPLWIKRTLDSCDVLFTYGNNGLSFVDPMQCNNCIFDENNPQHVKWQRQIRRSYIPPLQRILSIYMQNYYQIQVQYDFYKQLRFWAIKEIVNNFQNCLYGEEMLVSLYLQFLNRGKTIYSFDAKKITQRQSMLVRNEIIINAEQRRRGRAIAGRILEQAIDAAQELLPSEDDFDDDTASDDSLAHTLQTLKNRESEVSEPHESAVQNSYSAIFHDIILQSHRFYCEYMEENEQRFPDYINMLFEHLRSSDPQKKENICIYLPVADLVVLMTYFLHLQWPQEMQLNKDSVQLTHKSTSLLFSLQLERRAYRTIRDSILYPSSESSHCHLKL